MATKRRPNATTLDLDVIEEGIAVTRSACSHRVVRGRFNSGVAEQQHFVYRRRRPPPRYRPSPNMESISRLARAVAARSANLRFVLAIGVVAVVGSKLTHIYAHLDALQTSDLIRWGLSLFVQDLVLLLLVSRLLAPEADFPGRRPWLRITGTTLGFIIVTILLALASFNISFFFVTGGELHWRNIGFAGSSNSRKLLLAGLVSCLIVVGFIVLISWVLQDICHTVLRLICDILQWPFVFVWNKIPFEKIPYLQRWFSRGKYAHLPQHENEAIAEQSERMLKDEKDDEELAREPIGPQPPAEQKSTTKFKVFCYAFIGVILLAMFIEVVARPQVSSLMFMSWTLPLVPFVDFYDSEPILFTLEPVYGSEFSIGTTWDNRSAVARPAPFNWLPKDRALEGFEDWFKRDGRHYRGDRDPMRITNLDNDLLPRLIDQLSGVKIRHVVLVKLESTRKDVFPFRNNSLIYNELQNTWQNKKFPPKQQHFLSNLTPAANYITGDYKDGFEHESYPRRGGINCNSAHTTASYTLKSLTGTICGISPIIADFNSEVYNHIYQPCLPQIFKAFNTLKGNKATREDDDDFTSYRWRPRYMQAVTGTYDKQDMLMERLGFPPQDMVTMETMEAPGNKFGPPREEHVNWYILPETTLEEYIRDAFVTAKEKKERLFLTHLTGVTHHPFEIPATEEFVDLMENKVRPLAKYINAIGYVNGWQDKLLRILDEEGVADETLVIFVGDHGLSIAEHDDITPYFGAHVATFHVPLVLSHPKLPVINVDDPVISSQILPTILDLLRETGSLSKPQSDAALDLMHNMEGQSMIRPINRVNNQTGQGSWQFTLMSPGSEMLSVRDTNHPHFHIVVPIVDDIEWRFANTFDDPHENKLIVSFDFKSFLQDVELKHGLETAMWAESAAFMARWFVQDNWKRWEYNRLRSADSGPEGWKQRHPNGSKYKGKNRGGKGPGKGDKGGKANSQQKEKAKERQ